MDGDGETRNLRVLLGPEVFEQPYGGISRYVLEIHRRLPQHGVSSKILAGIHANRFVTGVSGVTGVRMPTSLEHRGTRVRRAVNARWAKARLASVDRSAIYHMTYFPAKQHVPVGRRTVVTVHDLIHALFPQYLPANDPTVERQRHACALADLVLANSETTKRDLINVLAVDPDKIVVTPLGVTTSGVAGDVGDGHRANGAHPGSRGARRPRPFLLYVGHRGGYKNWAGLVAALSRTTVAKELDLVCVGGGPLHERERELAQRSGLADRIEQLDADDRTLHELYRGATAFVYPSRYEGFGLPPLEAMLVGCPVVAARAGSIPEVLADAASYFDPDDVDDIARAVDVVVTDADLRDRLARGGPVHVTTYTWERTARETAAAYRSLV